MDSQKHYQNYLDIETIICLKKLKCKAGVPLKSPLFYRHFKGSCDYRGVEQW